MSCVLNLAYVFKFITNSLNQCTFAKDNFIREMHQAVLHVLSQFCDQMNAVYEELFKKTLGDISLISKQFAIDLCEDIGTYQRLSVICVRRSQNEVQDLTLVINDKVKLQAKEPPYAALSLCGQALEYFM